MMWRNLQTHTNTHQPPRQQHRTLSYKPWQTWRIISCDLTSYPPSECVTDHKRRDAESRGLAVRGSMIHHVVASNQPSLTLKLPQPPHFLIRERLTSLSWDEARAVCHSVSSPTSTATNFLYLHFISLPLWVLLNTDAEWFSHIGSEGFVYISHKVTESCEPTETTETNSAALQRFSLLWHVQAQAAVCNKQPKMMHYYYYESWF